MNPVLRCAVRRVLRRTAGRRASEACVQRRCNFDTDIIAGAVRQELTAQAVRPEIVAQAVRQAVRSQMRIYGAGAMFGLLVGNVWLEFECRRLRQIIASKQGSSESEENND